ETIPYKKLSRDKVKLPKRTHKGRYDDQASLRRMKFVEERYESRRLDRNIENNPMHSSGGSLAGMPYLRKTFDTSGKSPAQFYHSAIFYAAPSRGSREAAPAACIISS